MSNDEAFIESELLTAIILFIFDGHTKFKEDIILKQITLIKKLDLVNLNSNQDQLIKNVLKIPDEDIDKIAKEFQEKKDELEKDLEKKTNLY
ncbi:9785_t:CDS:2 [Gigaspora margarita]|uniref:9785_t:CDS:1 n=1 Tax=Gigaspora margarita TaxID=4874 RepID=A0ABN7UWL4_GIGMA|nr:9785_t:CDS:2 [Gigaspora margarita]